MFTTTFIITTTTATTTTTITAGAGAVAACSAFGAGAPGLWPEDIRNRRRDAEAETKQTALLPQGLTPPVRNGVNSNPNPQHAATPLTRAAWPILSTPTRPP